MLGLLRQGGDERDGGGAAADHHDPLAGVLEVIGPAMRVGDPAPESLGPLELRQVALVVGEVAASRPRRSRRSCCTVSPVSVRSTSTSQRDSAEDHSILDDALIEADPAIDPALLGRLADVGEDRVAVGERPRPLPGLEPEAEGVDVGIAANAGIAVEVPGAPRDAPRLEDRVAAARALPLEVMGGADPGDAGADDQDVEVLGLSCRRRSPRSGHSASSAGPGCVSSVTWEGSS